MAFTVAETRQLDPPVLQDLDVASSTRMHELGYTTMSDDGREYMYGRTSTTITAVPATGGAGYPAFLDVGDGGNVITSTQKDGYGHNFAGVFCAAAATTTPGATYLWIQKGGYVPSGAASTGAGAVLVANTGRFIEATTATCTSYDANAMGLATHSSEKADLMLM